MLQLVAFVWKTYRATLSLSFLEQEKSPYKVHFGTGNGPLQGMKVANFAKFNIVSSSIVASMLIFTCYLPGENPHTITKLMVAWFIPFHRKLRPGDCVSVN